MIDHTSHLFRYSSYAPGGIIGSSEGAPVGDITAEAGPDTPRPAVLRMIEAAELPDSLMGGNRAMRRDAAKWLPREEKEYLKNYRIRVGRSTCFPFYKDTVHDLSSKPFVKPVEVSGAPSNFDEFIRDVDGTGQTLTVFSRDLMASAIHRGMYHVLVDAPGRGETAADVANRRVYVRKIDPVDMLDIRDAADPAGRMHVIYARFSISRSVNNDTFNQEVETVIIELERDIDNDVGYKIEYTYDKSSGDWLPGPQQPYNPGGVGIPLFTLFTNQTGYFEAEPALEDLAWVNLAHFQSRADHAHVMRVARLITLVTLGFKSPAKLNSASDKGKDEVSLGPLSRINNANELAKVSFLEPSGRSIELSLEDMAQLEKEANRLGARYHSSGKSHVTAQSIISDNQKLSNNLNSFCVRMEMVLSLVLEAVGEWLNTGGQPVVMVNKEFDAKLDFDGGAKALQVLSDVLTPRQKIIEAMRYGFLREDFPIEENLAELEQIMVELEERMAAQEEARRDVEQEAAPEQVEE
jgi:hypothetical protein